VNKGISFFLTLALLLGTLPLSASATTTSVTTDNAAGTVRVSTLEDIPLNLSAGAFSSAFSAATDDSMYSLRFTVTATANGTIYYNYRSSADYDAVASTENPYYVDTDTDPALSDLTFVPAAGYVGTESFSYTACNAAGDEFAGTLAITVKAAVAEVISYTAGQDEYVSFRAADFNSACESLTGSTLSYVFFTLPDAAAGTLYYDYDASAVLHSPISSDTEYYYNAVPSLSDVFLVPASGFLGDVNVTYTGYDTAGLTYTGTVQISFEEEDEDDNAGSQHFRDVGIDLSWATEAIDYLFEQGIISGVKPGYYNPNASIKRGDFILMLCRAFDLSADSSGNFSDGDEDSYYADAISKAKGLGIAKGSNGKFNPNAALSRQDAMVFIARALDAAGISIEESSDLDLQKFTDYNKISDYAEDAVGTLVRARIIQGYGDKLNPTAASPVRRWP
jgi:hypothetical protein